LKCQTFDALCHHLSLKCQTFGALCHPSSLKCQIFWAMCPYQLFLNHIGLTSLTPFFSSVSLLTVN
jgi:hypothetical protein